MAQPDAGMARSAADRGVGSEGDLLAPIARPGFTWNHDKLMTDFGRGLAKATGGELTSVRNWTLKPGAPGFYQMPALEG